MQSKRLWAGAVLQSSPASGAACVRRRRSRERSERTHKQPTTASGCRRRSTRWGASAGSTHTPADPGFKVADQHAADERRHSQSCNDEPLEDVKAAAFKRDSCGERFVRCVRSKLACCAAAACLAAKMRRRSGQAAGAPRAHRRGLKRRSACRRSALESVWRVGLTMMCQLDTFSST